MVREAEPGDAADIARIAASREGCDPGALQERLEDEIDDPGQGRDRVLLVAELGDRVIGYARASWFQPVPDDGSRNCPPGWYLAGVVVDPGHRRLGVARVLTRTRLDWLAGRGCRILYFVNVLNGASIDLHAAFGFRELTRDFCYPGVRFTGGKGILFELSL